MIELRFLERLDEGERKGSSVKVLQIRRAAWAPWEDVPYYSLEEQKMYEADKADERDLAERVLPGDLD